MTTVYKYQTPGEVDAYHFGQKDALDAVLVELHDLRAMLRLMAQATRESATSDKDRANLGVQFAHAAGVSKAYAAVERLMLTTNLNQAIKDRIRPDSVHNRQRAQARARMARPVVEDCGG